MDSKLTVITSELNLMRQFENDIVVFWFFLSDDSLSEIGNFSDYSLSEIGKVPEKKSQTIF